MKILVHICCAPCFAYPHKKMREEEHEVIGYWYNPNIHPYMEYKARKDALIKYSKIENVEIIYGEYDFKDYLKQIKNFERPDRCINCYEYRLNKTAEYAKNNSFDAFSTTLLSSHNQYHNEIKRVGEKIGEKYGIKFYYKDFREGAGEARAIIKVYGLYTQKYCGCLISEWERFKED
ncbi:MAG: epoxyqueuosine reductase QueH [Thermoplasmatales archaeon]|nr:epoxyqueuosine reductase QueH [Thermoplasmatales archaeon]